MSVSSSSCLLSKKIVYLPYPDHAGINDVEHNQDTDSISMLTVRETCNENRFVNLVCNNHATQQSLKEPFFVCLCVCRNNFGDRKWPQISPTANNGKAKLKISLYSHAGRLDSHPESLLKKSAFWWCRHFFIVEIRKCVEDQCWMGISFKHYNQLRVCRQKISYMFF